MEGEQLTTDDFVHGMRYRVRFRLYAQKLDREMVATYMGCEGRRMWFDLRPSGGTTQIDITNVLGAHVLPRSAPHHNPKVVREDGSTDS